MILTHDSLAHVILAHDSRALLLRVRMCLSAKTYVSVN